MDETSTLLGERAAQAARAFGVLARARRKALNMTQDQLALATGVGRRFLIDLEAGKTTCQLGLSLVVAEALGLRPTDVLAGEESAGPADAFELPSPLDEAEEYAGAIDG
jgi:transcriptional regulator with XRE-family HTH domain